MLSGLPVDFFEDDLTTELARCVIAPALMEKFEKSAKTFRLDQIPAEQRFVDGEWLEDSDKENELTKESVAAAEESRFGSCVTDEKELDVFSKGFVPKNTDKNTEWALRNFKSWFVWRLKKNPEDPVPADLLVANDPVALQKWLSLYLIETRRKDGKKFPSKWVVPPC